MNTPTPTFSSPDQALIHRFLAGDGSPAPMDSNPFARALGAQLLSIDRKLEQVVLAFEPDSLFIQGTGVLQGGAVSAMLDFAMAFVVLACVPAGVSCATVNMSTSFLRPATTGRYRAIGELERCGKTLAFARARLVRNERDGSGAGGEKVVASATSTLALSAPAA